MYVNPFWFGVITTIVVEVVAFIVWAAIEISKGEQEQ